eukprot:GHRR01002896.1.p1 GENE.GHRR01002896.1~~GHRR01002896.1.p1  ORF type:complete len:149 (-),score=35.00 GHRR01002896.1:1013-1459(-)
MHAVQDAIMHCGHQKVHSKALSLMASQFAVTGSTCPFHNKGMASSATLVCYCRRISRQTQQLKAFRHADLNTSCNQHKLQCSGMMHMPRTAVATWQLAHNSTSNQPGVHGEDPHARYVHADICHARQEESSMQCPTSSCCISLAGYTG